MLVVNWPCSEYFIFNAVKYIFAMISIAKWLLRAGKCWLMAVGITNIHYKHYARPSGYLDL